MHNRSQFKILKKDHLQPLQTILRRIGPFVFILARSSARTHTPLQKCTRFEQNVQGLMNTQFKRIFEKKILCRGYRLSMEKNPDCEQFPLN